MDKVERQLLFHGETLAQTIIGEGNEESLMHLLLSLSKDAAMELMEHIPSYDLVGLLSNNHNGLSLFSRYYAKLDDEVKDSLSQNINRWF